MEAETGRTDGEGRLPDFIVIGAMKAGTSSLHEYLAVHPQVSMSAIKELNFFLPHRYDRLGLDWYRRQFSDTPDALVAGESSPTYSMCHEYPRVAELMHAVVPDARLVYVVRDPIRRLESQWVHLVGGGKIRTSLSEAVADLDQSLLVQTSRYWTQLSWYLRFWPEDRILVRQAERLAADVREVVGDVLEFVGLDRHFDHPVLDQRFHDSREKVRPNRLGRLVWGRPARRRRLAATVPWLVGSPIPAPTWEPGVRERVKDYLRPDIEALRKHTGLAFEGWEI